MARARVQRRGVEGSAAENSSSMASSPANGTGSSLPPAAAMARPSTRSAMSSPASCNLVRVNGEKTARVDGDGPAGRVAEALRDQIEGPARAGQPPGAERQHGVGEAQLVALLPPGAEPGTLLCRRLIARVLDPGLVPGSQRGDEAGLRHIEQRPRDTERNGRCSVVDGSVHGRQRRHAREAIDTAAARQPHEHRLGLVVLGMRGEQQADAVRAHVPAHEPVAGAARRGLDAGRRLRHPPRQGWRDGSRAPRRRWRPRAPRARLGPQAMVDGEHPVPRRVRATLREPIGEQHHHRRAVGAARHCERAGPFERECEETEQPVDLVGPDRLGGAGHRRPVSSSLSPLRGEG